MRKDCLGNVISIESAASLDPLNDFVEGFIASEARAVNVLDAASADHSCIVQAYAAALHMFVEARGGPQSARPHLDLALIAQANATPREQLFAQAVAAWVEGNIEHAIELHWQIAQEFPRDLVSLKLGHYHLFNRGDAPGMLRMALAVLPYAGESAYLHGMLAFAWEQCHFLEQAEAAAREAIALKRKEPWAHHALAHVMLTQGRIADGIAFLTDVSSTWEDLNSFMVTHNWWHMALFELELGHNEEALRIYDEKVWGVVKEYTQDQINAVSLLARLEVAGVDVGDRWQDVAVHLVTRLDDHVLPFLDLQYLYGLARAGRPEADTLMMGMTRHAAQMQALDPQYNPWLHVCLPAGRGLLAHARGHWALAMDQLGAALPRMLEIGGSHAQRDLFSQLYLDAMIKSGKLAAAQNILQPQLAALPESVRLRRQAAKVYSALGLPEVAMMLA